MRVVHIFVLLLVVAFFVLLLTDINLVMRSFQIWQ